MSRMGLSMNRPTMTSTGHVAEPGMERKSGAKMSATAKHTAVVKAVSPDRPPCATPEALSTYVAMALDPIIDPMVVPTASAMKARLRCGT